MFDIDKQQIHLKVVELSSISEEVMGEMYNSFKLFWIEEGNTNIIIDSRNIKLAKDQLIMVSPQQKCHYILEDNSKAKLIQFTERFLDSIHLDSNLIGSIQLLKLGSINQVISLDPKIMEANISLIESELECGIERYELSIIGNCIKNIIYQLERKYLSFESLGVSNIVQDFLSVVEINYAQKHLVKDYQDILNVDAKELAFHVKKYMGITPKTYINRRVILEAKKLLVKTSLSSKEIAYQLGFDDPANFVKFFKKNLYFSPLVFRGLSK